MRLLALLACMLALASSCAGEATTAPTPPGVDVNASFEEQVLAVVNQRRAAGGTCSGSVRPPVGALSMEASLRSAARAHSADMASNNYLAHVSLDGRTVGERAAAAGYPGGPLGENIAGGPSSPQAVVDMWMASAGHCDNIMSPAYDVTGVGYAFGRGSTYGHYWRQVFGG